MKNIYPLVRDWYRVNHYLQLILVQYLMDNLVMILLAIPSLLLQQLSGLASHICGLEDQNKQG